MQSSRLGQLLSYKVSRACIYDTDPTRKINQKAIDKDVGSDSLFSKSFHREIFSLDHHDDQQHPVCSHWHSSVSHLSRSVLSFNAIQGHAPLFVVSRRVVLL